MTEEKKIETSAQAPEGKDSRQAGAGAAGRFGGRPARGKKMPPRGKREEIQDEYEQKIVDLARVTRVMAGGKRMRFRACVAVGNKKGRVGVGIAKGADVTMAISKAATQAKKNFVDVPIVNDTIPHEITHKSGAAIILFRPASRGRGIIAGGAVRIVIELSGVKNITSKTLGTNNKVNNAKCVIEALGLLKKPAAKKEKVETEKKAVAPEAK